MNFAILPNLIALTVLVAIFWTISHKATTERLHLWLAGWFLVLVHFIAQFVSTGQGTWARIADTASLDSLALAGIAFLISVSTMKSAGKTQMALALTIPVLGYTTGVAWGITSPQYYYGLIAVGVVAPLVLLWRSGRKFVLVAVASGLVLVAAITIWAVARGTTDLGLIALLAALNFAVALLYWNSYRRATAGVVTAVAGFALWGAVFPAGVLLQMFAPAALPEAEAWNVPKYLVAVGMILTLLEDQIETSKYLAYHDDLTGLPNRRLLEDRLERALAHARRSGSRVAVLQLDLDHFKEVNDTYGHRVGDIALRAVVTRLSACVQPGDTLARSGGDEFTLISDVPDAKGAEALAEQLGLALSTPIRIDECEVQTGLSIGVALYPDDGHDPDQLHAAADRAMYISKRATRIPPSIEIFPPLSV